MGTPASAAFMVVASNIAELRSAISFACQRGLPWFTLGGGSNLILPKQFNGLVVRVALRGVKVVEANPESVLLEVAAGENWHDLVRRSLGLGLSGLESMALIPGTVGAAPVQNIGAYGGELSDVVERVEVLLTASAQTQTFNREACGFAYRDSGFKDAGEAQLITSVQLRLRRHAMPKVNYPDVQTELQRMGFADPTPQQVAEAVIAVRRRKLPDPRRHGNVGSFFKNPVVALDAANALFERFPELRSLARAEQLPKLRQEQHAEPSIDAHFSSRATTAAAAAASTTATHYKLPAAALIERAGWKGRVDGRVEAWRRQPLVLVNRGGAQREDVLATASRITADIRRQFAVVLQAEPRLSFPGEPVAKLSD